MQSRAFRIGLIAVIVAVASVLVFGVLGRDADRSTTKAPAPPERSQAPRDGRDLRSTGLAAVGSPPPSVAELEGEALRRARGPRPDSLSDTAVDGGLSVDEDGHFRPDPDALALFDYFLAASGEEPGAVIRQRILDEIARRLAPPADAEAAAFLDRYLGYRDALRGLADGGVAPPDLERRLQWLRELRRTHFGADTGALFGIEEATVQVDLERRRVFMDPSLGDAEKAERLAALDELLPDPVREARNRAGAPARVRDEVRNLRNAGADASEVFAVREAAFGTDAARRLTALDEERAAWNFRVDGYRAERNALLAELGYEPTAVLPERALPEADRARLDALRQTHFDEHELLRVRVLDSAL